MQAKHCLRAIVRFYEKELSVLRSCLSLVNQNKNKTMLSSAIPGTLFLALNISFAGHYPVDLDTHEVYYCVIQYEDDSIELLDFCGQPAPKKVEDEIEAEEEFALSNDSIKKIIAGYNTAICAPTETFGDQTTDLLLKRNVAKRAARRIATTIYPNIETRGKLNNAVDSLLAEDPRIKKQC